MTAMADIDLQAAIERGADHRMNLAVAIDEAAWMARERMSKNVARLQQGNDALEDSVDVLAVVAARRQAPELAEMHIDWQVRAGADFGRHFYDANAPAGEAAD